MTQQIITWVVYQVLYLINRSKAFDYLLMRALHTQTGLAQERALKVLSTYGVPGGRTTYEKFVAMELELKIRKKKQRTAPPSNASFLIELFLPSAAAEALVGDLEERYTRIYKKYGSRRAWLWYWFQTFITLRPLIAGCIKTISGLSLVADLYRRIRS